MKFVEEPFNTVYNMKICVPKELYPKLLLWAILRCDYTKI